MTSVCVERFLLSETSELIEVKEEIPSSRQRTSEGFKRTFDSKTEHPVRDLSMTRYVR